MCHPPCAKPPLASSSGPPGACETPSRLMNSLTMIRPTEAPSVVSVLRRSERAELIGGELDLERAEVLAQVLERQRARDREHRIRALHEPGQRDLRLRDTV